MIDKCSICNADLTLDHIVESGRSLIQKTGEEWRLGCSKSDHEFTWLFENKESDVLFCFSIPNFNPWQGDVYSYEIIAWYHESGKVTFQMPSGEECQLNDFGKDYAKLIQFYKSIYIGEGFMFL